MFPAYARFRPARVAREYPVGQGETGCDAGADSMVTSVLRGYFMPTNWRITCFRMCGFLRMRRWL
jgi:hypothetical protein